MPLPARGRGLSGSVTRIISLKIFAKAGAAAFASSTLDLYSHPSRLAIAKSVQNDRRCVPNLVAELAQRDLVRRVDDVPGGGLDEDAGLLVLAPEHDAARDERARVDAALLRDRDDLLACGGPVRRAAAARPRCELTGAEGDDVVLAADAAGWSDG